MIDLVNSALAGLAGPVLLLSLVLMVVWALLPFAVFGIKKRLDASLGLQRDILRELTRQREAPTGPDGRRPMAGE